MLQTFDERNRDLLVNINGNLIHRDQAGVSPFDSSCKEATPSGKACASITAGFSASSNTLIVCGSALALALRRFDP